MRSLIAALAIALLVIGVGACGSGSSGSVSHVSSYAVSPSSVAATGASSAALADGYLRGDDDNDEDAYNHFDDHPTRGYGHPASTVDRRAVRGLVKRYYSAAAEADGATACSLMLPRLANESNLGEAAEEIYALALNLPPLHGKSCAQIMSLLFKEDHKRLAADNATLHVTSVRLEGDNGLALLGFRTTPERKMPVQRERHLWGIDALLDSEIP